MEELIVALHMHTRYSDGAGLHKDLAEAGLDAGVDVLLVSDHNVLVQEMDGRFYEYFLVRYQEKSPEILEEAMDYLISPRLRKDQHPLLKEFIESKIVELESIQEKLDQSFQSSRNKNLELTNQKKYLKEMLLWL